MTSSALSTQLAGWWGSRTFGGMTSGATFCSRLALARYETLTKMMLMGHKDLKTTMRYIRAVQLQSEVRPELVVHKLATQDERPPLQAAVSF